MHGSGEWLQKITLIFMSFFYGVTMDLSLKI